MRRIVAIGGGGFMMEEPRSPIDDFLLALTGKRMPRMCFVPTASGDSEQKIDAFYAAFGARDCVPSHLAFFRKPDARALPLASFADALLQQDVIFCGGGNTKSALAVWRDWGADRAFLQALDAGAVLAGMSAGAIGWFERGLTDSWGDGDLVPIGGLGFLAGGCAPHYDGEANRRPWLHREVAAGRMPASIAIDDGAAVVYAEGEIERVVRWHAGRTAYRVVASANGVDEVALDAEALPS